MQNIQNAFFSYQNYFIFNCVRYDQIFRHLKKFIFKEEETIIAFIKE